MELQREYLRGARRKARATKDYFDDDDDFDGLEYVCGQQQSAVGGADAKKAEEEDEEVDPLDAFMQGIESQVVKEKDEKKPFAKAC